MNQKYMFFWNSLAFAMTQQILAIWSLVLEVVEVPSGSSLFCWGLAWSIVSITCWSLAWRTLSINLTSIQNKHNCLVVGTFFGIAFGIGMKTDLFQSWGHCWIFQICWCIECSTLTASYFRIWNRSAGIPSSPLALFVVMLSKVHLTSHSRMSGSRWVNTPSWLSGSLRLFLYSSSVYSCHLFLISSASIRSLPLLSFIMPILAWNIPLISPIFLKGSLVFPILLFSSTSLHCSLKKASLSLLDILWNSAFRAISVPSSYTTCTNTQGWF